MTEPQPPLDIGREQVAQAVDRAVDRYLDGCHARVADFVDRHFSARGSARLHARALGWDLLRAPANVALAGPQLAARAAGAIARHAPSRRLRAAGDWLHARDLMLKTDVAAEIEWRVQTELLCLPCQREDPPPHGRFSAHDALAEEILADPVIAAAVGSGLAEIGRHADDPAFRARLEGLVGQYADSRVAASDIATSLITLGIGALGARQFTPGLVSLAPALAGTLAKQMAVASFPLGAGLGSVWYGTFPAAAGPLLVAGVAGVAVAAAAALSAFAGIAADPIQRRLGLHDRRLHALVDALGRDLKGAGEMRFAVRDHYVARIFDLLDLLRSAHRLLRGG